MSLIKNYVQQIGTLGFLPTWLPNQKIELGDFGKIQGGVFTKLGSLSKNLERETTIDKSEAMSFEYCSKGCSLSGLASAQHIASQGKLQCSILFKSKNDLVFMAKDCRSESYADLKLVEDYVSRKYEKNDWEKNIFLICNVVKPSSTTVVLSNANGSKIDLQLEANFPTLISNLKISDVTSNFELVRSKSQGTSLNIINAPGLTPLFRAIGRTWFTNKVKGMPQIRTVTEKKAAVLSQDRYLKYFDE